MKKKAVEIPQVIYTNQFLRFVEHYATEFKRYNGYGKYWLKEWAIMEENGMFKPEKLRELYIKMLDGSDTLSYIYWNAVHCICVQALEAVKAFALTNSFEIRVITGEIAFNDNDEELDGLFMEEALVICKAMNDEAEELLFRVYNSNTNKPVK